LGEVVAGERVDRSAADDLRGGGEADAEERAAVGGDQGLGHVPAPSLNRAVSCNRTTGQPRHSLPDGRRRPFLDGGVATGLCRTMVRPASWPAANAVGCARVALRMLRRRGYRVAK